MTAPRDGARQPRLLLLSYAFPPATAPEAMLSAKRAGNIPGWDVEVIAAAPFHPGMGNDPDMAAYAASRFRAVHRLMPAVRLPWHRLGLPGRVPDAMRVLNRQAAAVARRLHAAEPFDAVLSWSTYHSVHLAARAFHERTRVPWLAHMSDPWVDNAYVQYGALGGAINRRLERRVIGDCDRILFTTPETVDLVMAKYPEAWRRKAVVIPHGFDTSLYSGRSPSPREGRPLVVRYLGNFYGKRTPQPLFEALGRLLAEQPAVLAGVVIEIIGTLDAGMADTAAARRLPDGMIRVLPPVGYRRSLELMETADLLLIVDAPAKVSVFLPSKLVDYIGARRPILSFTPPGASQRVTEEAGFWSAPPDDLDGMVRAFVAALEAVRAGAAVASWLQKYSVEETGRQLAEVLGEVTGGSAHRIGGAAASVRTGAA